MQKDDINDFHDISPEDETRLTRRRTTRKLIVKVKNKIVKRNTTKEHVTERQMETIAVKNLFLGGTQKHTVVEKDTIMARVRQNDFRTKRRFLKAKTEP